MDDHPCAARSRSARHQLIADILALEPVRSQNRLRRLLAARGVEVTQATLSRDLVELRAVKVRQGRQLVYVLPGPGGEPTPVPRPGHINARLRKACEDLIVSVTPSGNLVIARTPPGAAAYLGAALDHNPELDLIGTIAGDDTVLLVTGDPTGGPALAESLLRLSKGAGGAVTT